MKAIELLQNRQSTPVLTNPAPSEVDLNTILSAGMRVPDHAGLKPWHFHVVTGTGLQRLSDIFVEAVSAEQKAKGQLLALDEDDLKLQQDKLTKTAKMPFRAPMLIVVSTEYVEHNKVPKQEQLITAGCCSHAMQMAAFALGYGAMWRTGDLAYNDIVKTGLNIDKANDITGFLYIGTPTKEANVKPAKPYEEHVTVWS